MAAVTRFPPSAALIGAFALAACASAPVGPNSAEAPLARAALNGDEAGVRAALDAGADPNAPTARGYPVLFVAIEKGTPEMLRLFLDKGADANAINRGWTPLILAAHLRRTEMARLLIERGARVNQKAGQAAPLIAAVDAGDAATARLLLDRGADAGAPANGRNLVEDATYLNRPDLVALLVEHGAKPVGARGRVGLQLGQRPDGSIVVVQVLPGTPAADAGFRPGWIVLAVNGAALSGATVLDATNQMRGDGGTPVTLTVRGENGAERDITLTRQAVGSGSGSAGPAPASAKPWWQQ